MERSYLIAYGRARAALLILLLAAALPAEAASPVVMLTMSKDEHYFHKAYDDGSDLDGDGVVEHSYNDRLEYDGYFHPHLCYAYSDANQRFEPSGRTDASAHRHYCLDALSETFSGNFLNWASMTRMDLTRRALYGGKRSTDSVTLTVLDRAHLPPDTHSFAKYYNGADLAALTPFDVQRTDTTNGGNNNTFDDGNEGITLCNVSYDGTSAFSHTTGAAPLLRIVSGARRLWAGNERWQCTWESERGDNSNANNPAHSGLDASSSDPPDTLRLLTAAGSAERVVRVLACDPAYFDTNDNLEHCRDYPAGNRKPAGVLQNYGENGALRFGLLSGSWARNLSGGVLRKNAGTISDEIAVASTGAFLAAPANGGIIAFLDTLRVWGYQYSDGVYFPNADDCGFQQATITEGRCRAWGNPRSEMYLETLRYLAGETAPSFAANDQLSFANLPSVTWQDAVQAGDPPKSLNIVLLGGSPPTYDSDQTASTLFGGISTQSLTNQVGVSEGLSGGVFAVGRVGIFQDELCSAKTLGQLADASGPCPDAPSRGGSWHIAGMAAYAHGHDMRAAVAGSQTITTYSVELPPLMPRIRVPRDGFRAHDVTITPAFSLLFNKSQGTLVAFQVVRSHTEIDPSDRSSPGLPNTIADGTPDIVNGEPTVNFPLAKAGTGIYHAKYYLAWDDSEQGGDLDQDLWGTLDYVLDTTVSPLRLSVTTKTVATSSVNGQLFGFVISGTTQDGFHAYSGVFGATLAGYDGVPGCNNCRALSETGGQRGPQSHSFTLANAGTTLAELPSASLLAAKWGGYVDSNGNGVPEQAVEWDKLFADGNLAAAGEPADGVPDNFYALENPNQLRARLEVVMSRIHSPSMFVDSDGDDSVDGADNCPGFSNGDQRDTNGDGHGNACDADLNNDGIVNAFDLAGFKGVFGTANADADFNGDGIVNARDLARFKALFGTRF